MAATSTSTSTSTQKRAMPKAHALEHPASTHRPPNACGSMSVSISTCTRLHSRLIPLCAHRPPNACGSMSVSISACTRLHSRLIPTCASSPSHAPASDVRQLAFSRACFRRAPARRLTHLIPLPCPPCLLAATHKSFAQLQQETAAPTGAGVGSKRPRETPAGDGGDAHGDVETAPLRPSLPLEVLRERLAAKLQSMRKGRVEGGSGDASKPLGYRAQLRHDARQRRLAEEAAGGGDGARLGADVVVDGAHEGGGGGSGTGKVVRDAPRKRSMEGADKGGHRKPPTATDGRDSSGSRGPPAKRPRAEEATSAAPTYGQSGGPAIASDRAPRPAAPVAPAPAPVDLDFAFGAIADGETGHKSRVTPDNPFGDGKPGSKRKRLTELLRKAERTQVRLAKAAEKGDVAVKLQTDFSTALARAEGEKVGVRVGDGERCVCSDRLPGVGSR